MNYSFDRCIIIGSGQLAFNCSKYLHDIYKLDCVYEYGSYMQSRLEVLCTKNNIPYVKLLDKTQCNKLMDDIEKEHIRILIVSASNTYIFPEFITKNDNIKIVNYHPALLTKHLGRNTEAWAIYEQDEAAGVTWHEVTSEIDHGAILAKKDIELDRDITSLKLMIKQYQIGFELFKEFIGSILENKEIQKNLVVDYGKMHYSYEKPNNGILDVTWDENRISAFLRSMDYGSLEVMGKPFIIEKGSKYCWDSYKILNNSISGEYADTDRIIEKENITFVLHNFCIADNV